MRIADQNQLGGFLKLVGRLLTVGCFVLALVQPLTSNFQRLSEKSRKGRHVYSFALSPHRSEPRQGRHVAPHGAGHGLGAVD
jgi:hypothetical protein